METLDWDNLVGFVDNGGRNTPRPLALTAHYYGSGDMWEFLKHYAEARGLLPMMTFETTLLGKVPYARNNDGTFYGVIPARLQHSAHENGFSIEAADFRRNAYTLLLS